MVSSRLLPTPLRSGPRQVAGAQQYQLLHIRRKREADIGIDAVDVTGFQRSGDGVAGMANKIIVVAGPADEGIVAGVTGEDHLGARAGEVGGAEERQRMLVGGEREADVRRDAVAAGADILDDVGDRGGRGAGGRAAANRRGQDVRALGQSRRGGDVECAVRADGAGRNRRAAAIVIDPDGRASLARAKDLG